MQVPPEENIFIQSLYTADQKSAIVMSGKNYQSFFVCRAPEEATKVAKTRSNGLANFLAKAQGFVVRWRHNFFRTIHFRLRNYKEKQTSQALKGSSIATSFKLLLPTLVLCKAILTISCSRTNDLRKNVGAPIQYSCSSKTASKMLGSKKLFGGFSLFSVSIGALKETLRQSTTTS